MVCGKGLPSASSSDGAFSPAGIAAVALATGAALADAEGGAALATGATGAPPSDAEPAELAALAEAALALGAAGAARGVLTGGAVPAPLDS